MIVKRDLTLAARLEKQPKDVGSGEVFKRNKIDWQQINIYTLYLDSILFACIIWRESRSFIMSEKKHSI